MVFISDLVCGRRGRGCSRRPIIPHSRSYWLPSGSAGRRCSASVVRGRRRRAFRALLTACGPSLY